LDSLIILNLTKAVALQKCFFDTLPQMPVVEASQADLAWLLYDLKKNQDANMYELVKHGVIYTEFNPALERIIKPVPGDVEDFIQLLQNKLDEQLDGNPPDAPTLTDTLLQ